MSISTSTLTSTLPSTSRRRVNTMPIVVAMLMMIGAFSTGCARAPRARATAPREVLGTFEDDYGGSYQITEASWHHGTRTRYDVVSWHVDPQFLIAQNASTNPSAPSLWTRIDWVRLDGMAPYEWAYCLSAYKAPSRAAAETTSVAKRASPRTGCNGFPFSRMKRVAPG